MHKCWISWAIIPNSIFHDEENLIWRASTTLNFPPRERRIMIFMAEVAKLKKDYKESGGNILLIINSNQMVIEWLTKHISLMDKKIGVYAKTL